MSDELSSDDMTVGELMGLLEEEPNDAIVRIIHHPSFPLQEVLGGVASSQAIDIYDDGVYDDEDVERDTDGSDEVTTTVYLVASGHAGDIDCGPSSAWKVMRRR